VKEMFATKLKVASALFLSFFIIWLILILLVGQPTDNVNRIQFSNSALLALFLGSAAVASLSSMVIGLNFLGFEMIPISLKKKFGRGQVTLQTRKSLPTVQHEELQLPDHSLSISDPNLISCPNCSKVFKTPRLGIDFRCQYWFGYLAQKEYGKPIPNECIECEKVMDCLLEKEAYSTEAVNEIKKWLR